MIKLVQMSISSCRNCPYYDETGGLAGEAEWCLHELNGQDKPRQILRESYKDSFPTWCPLPEIKQEG